MTTIAMRPSSDLHVRTGENEQSRRHNVVKESATRGARAERQLVDRRGRSAMLAPPWIPVPPPGYGGIEHVVALLCDTLVDRGRDVELICVPASHSRAKVHALLPAAVDKAGRLEPADCRRGAERFSPARVAARYEEIYLDAVRARRRVDVVG
jgi:hypothetical protein